MEETSYGQEKEKVQERLLKREELIDELNQLVTRLGPQPLHRGLPMNEGFEAIIACIKDLEAKCSAK